MQYYSTNDRSLRVELKEAILRSLPADNGLYMPVELPQVPDGFWDSYRGLSFQEIGHAVAKAFFSEDVPESAIEDIVNGTLEFDAPVVSIGEQDHILELFHGPTLAFKDFGARFMARLMAWLTRDDDQMLTVLVATSGDTGGAVASALCPFLGASEFSTDFNDGLEICSTLSSVFAGRKSSGDRLRVLATSLITAASLLGPRIRTGCRRQ